MPIGPRDSGWFSGNAPLPLKVVRTGSISVSATAWSSANADEMTVPPPASMTGFSEWSMVSIAFSTFTMSGSVHGWYPWIPNSSGNTISASFCCTSLGTSINTGPGRPVSAIKKLFATASGISAAVLGWKAYLSTGFAMPMMSLSWNASRPIIFTGTWPVTATMGAESACAVAMPVRMFVAPGPEVAKHTPGFLLTRPKPSAMWAADCSCRTRMCLMSHRANSSYIGRFAPPGRPNTCLTPSRSMATMSAFAPDIFSILFIKPIAIILMC